jgi:hypothetical protein
LGLLGQQFQDDGLDFLADLFSLGLEHLFDVGAELVQAALLAVVLEDFAGHFGEGSDTGDQASEQLQAAVDRHLGDLVEKVEHGSQPPWMP